MGDQSRVPRRRSRAALWLAPLLLVGCDQGAAEIVGDINAAREGCTQEALKAGDEECVQMFEEYAGMGTEAIETYIGAVQALDEALRRMPPAQFDTAGLGHAVTPSLSPEPTSPSPHPSGYSPSLGSAGYGDPYDQERAAAPRGWGGGPGGYSPRGGYPEAGGWSDPRLRDPYADDRYRQDGYYDEYYDDRFEDPRYGGGRYPDGRYPGGGEGPYRGGGGAWMDEPSGGRWDDPRYGQQPPPPGGLLPPEQRLSRPWLREQGDPRYDTQQRWRVLPPRRDPRAYPDSLSRGEPPNARVPRRRH